MSRQLWTPSGVRLREQASRPGELNWLFLPGGPGIGSESLAGLAAAAGAPGVSWLVDLPGDGSNVDAPGAGADPFARWPAVLFEAAQAVSDAVFVGHSTGGMYLLSVPELESHIAGLVLVSSAPHAGWMAAFGAMTESHPLPEVDAATAAFEQDRTDANLGRVAVASAPWNFAPGYVDAGAQLLRRMPYNVAAVDWSAEEFDNTYRATWWPTSLPTLIVSGSLDRIVDQSLWNEPRFHQANVQHRVVDGGAHFPWVERPDLVHNAFADFVVGGLEGKVDGHRS
jgi:pimeloyl-ACP methyl ester carboxylesterase